MDLRTALSYSLRPFPVVSHILTLLLSSVFCPRLPYLQFPAPRLCSSVLVLTSPLTLHLSTSIGSKPPINADAIQQNVSLFLYESEFLIFSAGKRGRRLLRSTVLQHICGLGYRPGLHTWRRRTSARHRLGSAGGTR